MDLFLKACLGALMVVLMDALSRTKNFYVVGLIPLFPTFSLIAHYMVGTRHSAEHLRTTIVFGVWSLIPWLIYMLAVYLLIGRMSVVATLACAVALWLLGAYILLNAWSRFVL